MSLCWHVDMIESIARLHIITVHGTILVELGQEGWVHLLLTLRCCSNIAYVSSAAALCCVSLGHPPWMSIRGLLI